MIPENATLFSIFLQGKRIREKTPCDVTACRREYLRTAPKFRRASFNRLGSPWSANAFGVPPAVRAGVLSAIEGAVMQIRELSPDAKPQSYWETRHPDLVGTHVVTNVVYGGEVYASVNLVAKKQSYLQEIKAEVAATLSKEGAFDIDAQGKMEMLAQNVSNKAKMEIDYYGTVPLDDVPTTIEGLRNLVAKFRDQVQRVNNGVGVAICAGFRPLSDFNDKYTFLKNK
ncbi:hypothetical protein AVEN_269144-1 [Araneus ventricosus]|uniref:Uncharacterized protein n=1 Tax=Araneus ventricosus TaxID=182803 RepID=A0A4Y2TG35_ARAVE|nr:hypothetical protein AVEN_269144-1 [Araneus ventricosus]